MSSKFDFAAILASSVHDMKNSLSMLINQLEDIGELWHPTDPEAADKLAHLQYQSKRLNSQLVQMLALYKIGNSQYYLNLSDHNIEEFLQEATLHHSEILKRQGITIDVVADSQLQWFFDRHLVYGVINNVLNNAYKYSKKQVRVSAEQADGFLVIRVADDGDGYPEEMLTRKQDGPTSISFESGSTGLGLLFSHQVAELHVHKERRGHIVLDNQGINGGGRFSLYLP